MLSKSNQFFNITNNEIPKGYFFRVNDSENITRTLSSVMGDILSYTKNKVLGYTRIAEEIKYHFGYKNNDLTSERIERLISFLQTGLDAVESYMEYGVYNLSHQDIENCMNHEVTKLWNQGQSEENQIDFSYNEIQNLNVLANACLLEILGLALTTQQNFRFYLAHREALDGITQRTMKSYKHLKLATNVLNVNDETVKVSDNENITRTLSSIIENVSNYTRIVEEIKYHFGYKKNNDLTPEGIERLISFLQTGLDAVESYMEYGVYNLGRQDVKKDQVDFSYNEIQNLNVLANVCLFEILGLAVTAQQNPRFYLSQRETLNDISRRIFKSHELLALATNALNDNAQPSQVEAIEAIEVVEDYNNIPSL